MSDRIDVGDLVVVVKWPCCGEWIGIIYRVASMEVMPHAQCRTCGRHHGKQLVALREKQQDGGVLGVPLAWLRKLPPLAEPESERTDEEIEA